MPAGPLLAEKREGVLPERGVRLVPCRHTGILACCSYASRREGHHGRLALLAAKRRGGHVGTVGLGEEEPRRAGSGGSADVVGALERGRTAKGDVAPVTDDRTGWYNRKLYLAPGQREENRGNNQPTNLRLIRLAEVYLNYAEACYFSGDIANAQKYLNEVRSHVNLAPKNHTGSQLFEDIMNERHLEFGMEGFRFFDVVRVGWGEKVFNGTKKAEFGAKTPFSAGAEVLPIPQTEIDISDGLITN